MKKLIFSAFTFVMISAVAANAQVAPQDRPETTQEQTTQDQDRPAFDSGQEMRTEVQMSELPEAISSKLQEDEYQDWTPTASYLVRDENEETVYHIDLQKEDEMKTVKFDSEGNKIDKDHDKDHDKDQE
ncbi:hypothetical protein BH23BAC1_BH23BAC1_12580 [soil metagenome]